MADILNNKQDLKNNTASQLIGLEISVARERLGYWWVLESQNFNGSGSQYNFVRAGVGKITLYTNEKNIVVQTPASDIWSDEKTNSIQSMFKRMSDWCMAKDYNGAERFNDGNRPLMAETKFADVIISGIPNKNEVSINVHPYYDLCDYFYEGEIASKELAEQIGKVIVNYISLNADGQLMFTSGDFKDFFKTLKITDIRTHEYAEETEDNILEYEEDQDEEEM